MLIHGCCFDDILMVSELCQFLYLYNNDDLGLLFDEDTFEFYDDNTVRTVSNEVLDDKYNVICTCGNSKLCGNKTTMKQYVSNLLDKNESLIRNMNDNTKRKKRTYITKNCPGFKKEDFGRLFKPQSDDTKCFSPQSASSNSKSSKMEIDDDDEE